jgi:hypothetical protein
MNTSITQILHIINSAVETNLVRRWNLAPECQYVPDDRFYRWASNLIEDNRELFVSFIQEAVKEDLEKIVNCLNDDKLPAHRRAFFTELLILVKELEGLSVFASKDFAAFYRQRYECKYMFNCELPSTKEKKE